MAATILVMGATGTIGREVVAELGSRGISARALTRGGAQARRLLGDGVEVVVGDLRDPRALGPVLEGVDGVILAHGGDADPEGVYVGGVRALVEAVGERRLPVALMSSINVERPAPGPYALLLGAKKRGEEVLRASGLPYTVIRPGWFDAAGARDDAVVLRQGDRMERGGVHREHVAQALVEALLLPAAKGVTVEVFSAPGGSAPSLAEAFAQAECDAPSTVGAGAP